MLYYIAVLLKDAFNPANVLTYHTVRAAGAAITGFLVALLIGPAVIRQLRYLKVGQYIREDHVKDLHELHKKKAGTPTMGGALILLSTLISLALWGRWNRLLVVALLVFIALGAVGFLDDYIKLVRKNNKGLSAKAKFTGQIIVGFILGVYLVVFSITPPPTRLTRVDVLDWNTAENAMHEIGATGAPTEAALSGLSDREREDAVLLALNTAIQSGRLRAFFERPGVALTAEAKMFLRETPDSFSGQEVQRMNRVALECAFPDAFGATTADLHTKIEIPGLRNVFIPLGIGYVLFVLVIIVGSSNAVNLTDGLDGLAIGASVISLMAYTAIAYVVSRADWSRYLFLVHVPEASELTVFGAALLGTGLGFMWFNSHPAEVFMGDTGSLALGGALGTMAILTKQELLLLVVGGLFVIEAGSVILQVASFKLRRKRIFKMAPLHHHFELMGWSETKVVIRFWIIAIIFALLSLSALKLR